MFCFLLKVKLTVQGCWILSKKNLFDYCVSEGNIFKSWRTSINSDYTDYTVPYLDAKFTKGQVPTKGASPYEGGILTAKGTLVLQRGQVLAKGGGGGSDSCRGDKSLQWRQVPPNIHFSWFQTLETMKSSCTVMIPVFCLMAAVCVGGSHWTVLVPNFCLRK